MIPFSDKSPLETVLDTDIYTPCMAEIGKECVVKALNGTIKARYKGQSTWEISYIVPGYSQDHLWELILDAWPVAMPADAYKIRPEYDKGNASWSFLGVI